MAVIQSKHMAERAHVAQPDSANGMPWQVLYTISALKPLVAGDICEMQILGSNTMVHSLEAVLEGPDSAGGLSLDWGIYTGTPGDRDPTNRVFTPEFGTARTQGRTGAFAKVDLLDSIGGIAHSVTDTFRVLAFRVVAPPATPVVGKRIILRGVFRDAYGGF